MLWIGAIFGALFGWIGILVAALFWATLAIIKLLWALTLFAAQLIIGVSALIARAIIYTYHQIRSRNATPPAATSTKRHVAVGLKPKRVARKRKGTKR
jgi:dolichyl-phosphate-mannose--protein O-mannosyl transferase